ncbi:MAG: 5-oxoprolinase subunit PxpB, partial [Cyclobacteriaceae bacterium]|nr:5-oxoprolinase subunit PxpB [Cyclobacteriaceae bacterium]
MPSGVNSVIVKTSNLTVTLSGAGEQGITVSFPHHPESREIIVSFSRMVQSMSVQFILDVIPSIRSVTLIFDVYAMVKHGIEKPQTWMLETTQQLIIQFNPENISPSFRRLRIPVCYHPDFGLDLTALCAAKRLSESEVVDIHTSVTYRVLMLGFLPGFAYMGYVNERLQVTRHAQPRRRLEAGSVGIAGKQTGVYPLPSPGGWFIIGRTPLQVFTPDRATSPTLFLPG